MSQKTNIEWCDSTLPFYNRSMAQTFEGAQKIAAAKAGVTLTEYKNQVERGFKWCYLCCKFESQDKFAKDSSRYDGLAAACRNASNARARSKYKPTPKPSKGRSFVPARDNDKSQARRRINYFVEQSILPHPNSLPCVDCGHVYPKGRIRHEYDHYLGYEAMHHEHVEAVCSKCHHRREEVRGVAAKPRKNNCAASLEKTAQC